MSIESRIMSAVTPTVSEIEPNAYTGTALTYCSFNYDVIPSVFAESKGQIARFSIQLHLYLPRGENPNAKRRAIIAALQDEGFTTPSVVNASDGDGQHYIFEFEGTDGQL